MRFAQLGSQYDEFQALVSDWLATARHPRFDRPYTELTYAPMKELLAIRTKYEVRDGRPVVSMKADWLKVFDPPVR